MSDEIQKSAISESIDPHEVDAMKMHMVQALNQALAAEMERDERVMLLGEDVGVDGGVFRVTDGLIERFGAERVVDTPLAEAGIIGTSIGLAMAGMRPIPEMQFSGFSYQAFHHFKQHMSRIRQRSSGTFSAPLVVRMPVAGGIRALEHHSESPESFFIHTQGLKVVCPSGPYDAKGLLLASIRDPDPVLFLEPKSVYRAFKEDVPEDDYTLELGKANLVQEGSGVTVITWGAMLRQTLASIEGLDAEVIDLRTLWPLDFETIEASVKKTGRVVIVHEAPRALGFGAEIAAQIQEKLILHLEAPIKRVTSFDVPFPPFSIEHMFIPNPTRIRAGIEETLHY